MNKRGDGGVTAIVIIAIIAIFLGWLVNVGNRECNKNSDCGDDSYCGVDYSCHKIPVIEESNSPINADYTKPALILGAAIILSVFLSKIGGFANKWLEIKKEQLSLAKKEANEAEIRIEQPRNLQPFPIRQNAIKPDFTHSTRKGSINFTGNLKNGGHDTIGIILSALLAISLLLSINIEYLAIGVIGAIFIFIINYQIWVYCLEHGLEGLHIGVLSFACLFFALFITTKGGAFAAIGIGLIAITAVAIANIVALIVKKNKALQ